MHADVLQCTHMKKATMSINMAARTTFTFQTTPEIKARLQRLADVTRRPKAFLANEAVDQYLAAEEEFVAAVQEGIADADAGRVLTTAEMKTSLHKYIEKNSKTRKAT